MLRGPRTRRRVGKKSPSTNSNSYLDNNDEMRRSRISHGDEVEIDLLEDYQDQEFHNTEKPIEENMARKYLKLSEMVESRRI